MIPGAFAAAIGAGLLAALRFGNQSYIAGAIEACWCGFFVLLYRGQVRAALWLALLGVMLPRAVYVVAGLGPIGPALLVAGWTVLLVLWLLDKTRPRILLTAVMLITAVAAAGDVVTVITSISEWMNGTVLVFWRYNPLRTIWRQVVTPVVLTLYWFTQIRFLARLREAEHG